MAASDNQVMRVLLSSWLFAGLSALFLGLRIGCKLKSKRGLWLDDYVLIASWVGFSHHREEPLGRSSQKLLYAF